MDFSKSTVEIKFFSNICRVCLNNGDFKTYLDSTMSITQKECIVTLKNITGIEIKEEDKLPSNICESCIKQLCDIANFIKTCQSNDNYLKSILPRQEENVSLHGSDDLHCNDNDTEGEDSFDEIENTALSERKIKAVTRRINIRSSKEESRFKDVLKLRQRKLNLNLPQKRIEECDCKICGKKFTRRGGLKRHSKIHMGIKPFECKMCGKTFVEKATLSRHYLTHTGEKPFECNLCGKATTRKDQLLEHISKHHPNAVNCDFVITEHKRIEIDTEEIGTAKKSSDQNNYVKEQISNNEINAKQDRVQENDSAKDAFDTSFELNDDHTSITDETRQFKTKKRIEICLCNLCGKVFRRKGYLKNHMAIHAKIKPFECTICGKGFTQRHALTRHNLVHTKERPFQCNLCGKTFTRKEILMDHLKNHEEGSKPYLCFHCGKCFSNKDYLSKHLKYYLPGKGKKPPSEEKKCVCPQCGKELHSVSYLKTHLLTHTGEKPYECDICGNRFTVLRSLNHHLNIHKGIKPYQCTQCEKAFRTSGSLRKHILLHTGERPFKCTTCEKGFIRRSHLKRHLRIH